MPKKRREKKSVRSIHLGLSFQDCSNPSLSCPKSSSPSTVFWIYSVSVWCPYRFIFSETFMTSPSNFSSFSTHAVLPQFFPSLWKGTLVGTSVIYLDWSRASSGVIFTHSISYLMWSIHKFSTGLLAITVQMHGCPCHQIFVAGYDISIPYHLHNFL